MIENEFRLENKLQDVGEVTKEMNWYATVYEMEQTLKESTVSVNLLELAATLDFISREMNMKSNLQQQLHYQNKEIDDSSKYKRHKSSERAKAKQFNILQFDFESNIIHIDLYKDIQ